MSKFLLTAEERIKQAAGKIFLEKGFSGTTTRDIAEEANLNIGLLNYYFRSKEKLFMHVFSDMLEILFKGINEILNKPIGLEEKITALIDHEFAAYLKNPDLPMFIHNELHHNPDRFLKLLNPADLLQQSYLEKQLQEAITKGEMRPVTVPHLLLLIISNVQFVFHSKILLQQTWNLTEANFKEFVHRHQTLVKEMIASFLYIKQAKQNFLPTI